jgi:ABC-type glycerol-3-phosphate transport system permease component
MVSATFLQKFLSNLRTHVGIADVFTIVCGLALLATGLYLAANQPILGINPNLAFAALGAIAFAVAGLLFPRFSQYTAFGAAFFGANAILYYLDVYSDACRFNREMNDLFWLSSVAAGGLFAQVFISRQPPTLHQKTSHKTQITTSKGKSRKIRNRVSTGSVVLYIVMIVLAFIALVPFLWMISTSFMTLGETLNRTWVPSDAQMCNYYTSWNSGRFNLYFRNSVIIALATIAGLLVVSILSAYAFAKINFYGRGVIFTALLATLMVPDIVVMLPNYLTVSGQIFPLPITTDVFPFIDFGTGRSFTWIDTLPALTVPFMGSAFSIFLLRQFFVQIPHDPLFVANRLAHQQSAHLDRHAVSVYRQLELVTVAVAGHP